MLIHGSAMGCEKTVRWSPMVEQYDGYIALGFTSVPRRSPAYETRGVTGARRFFPQPAVACAQPDKRRPQREQDRTGQNWSSHFSLRMVTAIFVGRLCFGRSDCEAVGLEKVAGI